VHIFFLSILAGTTIYAWVCASVVTGWGQKVGNSFRRGFLPPGSLQTRHLRWAGIVGGGGGEGMETVPSDAAGHGQ
jgi:hypothetical protein